jgi:hypothetical protein
MQTARKLNTQINHPVNDSQHSARLEKILLGKQAKKDNAVGVGYEDIPIESRLQAENELEQALIKMFGYQ